MCRNQVRDLTEGEKNHTSTKSIRKKLNAKKKRLSIKKTLSIEDYQNLKKKEFLLQAIESKKTHCNIDINENAQNLDRKHFTLRRKKLALKTQLKFFQLKLSEPTQKSICGMSGVYDKGSLLEDISQTKNKIETPVSFEEYMPKFQPNDINYRDLTDEDKLESNINF